MQAIIPKKYIIHSIVMNIGSFSVFSLFLFDEFLFYFNPQAIAEIHQFTKSNYRMKIENNVINITRCSRFFSRTFTVFYRSIFFFVTIAPKLNSVLWIFQRRNSNIPEFYFVLILHTNYKLLWNFSNLLNRMIFLCLIHPIHSFNTLFLLLLHYSL